MRQTDLDIMRQVIYLPVPENEFIDVFCDTWTPPEDIALTSLHYGYEGRLMDADRIRKSFQKAIGELFSTGGERLRG